MNRANYLIALYDYISIWNELTFCLVRSMKYLSWICQGPRHKLSAAYFQPANNIFLSYKSVNSIFMRLFSAQANKP
jgi:hypothetical protein